jgi:GntR family transcriptional regulator
VHLVIDPHRGVPAYRQLVDQIRLQVASGTLAPGAELPSTRALAQRLGINPMTVSKAYGLLETEGVLRHRPGLPLTVSPRPAAALEDDRERHLRDALLMGAQAAVQLGISTSRAVALLREAIADMRRQSHDTDRSDSTEETRHD